MSGDGQDEESISLALCRPLHLRVLCCPHLICVLLTYVRGEF
jgi:hypothetical protein